MKRRLPERFYRDVWLLVVTGLVTWALFAQQSQLDDVQRVQDDTAQLVRTTARLAAQIQQQRRSTVSMNCRDQNGRHDATIGKLDEIIAGLPEGPEKDRAVANKASTVLLIDALVPKRNCRRVLDETTSPVPERLNP